MEKPNLDNDPKWRVWDFDNGEFHVGPKFEDGFLEICNLQYTDKYKQERKEKAKAISAVPEMIDALIKAHEILNPFDEEASNVKADIGNALEKAGVKL